jgi:hypothetical protein
MSTYCAKTDIEQVFGPTNVSKWSDLDNDADATKIANRITAAIAYASESIDDILRCTSYPIPVVTAADATPATVKDLAAKLAGIWLYEARGSQDFDRDSGQPYHRYAWVRRDCYRTLEDIRTGRRKLDARI